MYRVVDDSSLSLFFAPPGSGKPDGVGEESAVNQVKPAVLQSSPVPKCEGPVAPSSGLEKSPRPWPPAIVSTLLERFYQAN